MKIFANAFKIIFQYDNEMTEFEFLKNIFVQYAVIRRFKITGEASLKISTAFKSVHPQIEWQLMKDMRNKLSHEYFGVLMSTIYSTVKSDLPLLLERIKKLT